MIVVDFFFGLGFLVKKLFFFLCYFSVCRKNTCFKVCLKNIKRKTSWLLTYNTTQFLMLRKAQTRLSKRAKFGKIFLIFSTFFSVSRRDTCFEVWLHRINTCNTYFYYGNYFDSIVNLNSLAVLLRLYVIS